MSDEPRGKDPGAAWRDQPEEKIAENLQHLVNRRTQSLYSSTRWEIVVSLCAPLFLVAVMAWRFGPDMGRLHQIGFAVVIAWILVSLYWFRDLVWGRDAAVAVAATGLDYYRRELERRRNHLRNAWVWHGPVLLACLILVATLAGKALPHLGKMLPFVALLAIWVVAGYWGRMKQAREIQREIDEIGKF